MAEPKEALAAAGAELVAEAAANAPRRTGRLAGSHRLLPRDGKSVRVTNSAPYAAVIHWGWPGHDIRRQPWLVATWLRSSRPMDKASDGGPGRDRQGGGEDREIMPVHLMHLVVYLDDGASFEVHADQRDMRRAFIALGIQDPALDVLGFPRACAWAYLSRVGEIDGMGWKTFDAETVEVSPLDDEPMTEVDPTGPAPAG